MKKRLIATVALVLLMLSGCGAAPGRPARYIEKAALTAEEENILKLMGAGSGTIYDFGVDDSVRSLRIRSYRLTDGAWEPFVDGSRQLDEKWGRIALSHADLSLGLRIGLQAGEEQGSTDYSTQPEGEAPKSMATSRLEDRVEIVYDREIPLVLQVSTEGSTLQSYGVDAFFTPEVYQGLGYQVYAVTVLFSQRTVAELEVGESRPAS